MQTAAKNLIDQLSALAKNPGDVYISIIPFAKDVNVGASNYNQNWIDWTAQWVGHYHTPNTSNKAPMERLRHAKEPTWIHRVPSTHFTHSTADQEKSCPVAKILPLTYNLDQRQQHHQLDDATGCPNQTIGLQWGWLSCCSSDP